MDFQGHVENIFKMVRREPLVFILGSILVWTMQTFSLGLLAGPAMGGYLIMTIAFLRDGKRPEFNDLFSGFSIFGRLFPFCFLSWIFIAGFILMVVPGVLFMAMWLYTLALMVDKKMTLGAAMAASREKSKEKGFFMHVVFVFLVTILPAFLIRTVFIMSPVTGKFLLMLVPLYYLGTIASLYLEQFEGIPPRPPFENLDEEVQDESGPGSGGPEEQVRRLPGE